MKGRARGVGAILTSACLVGGAAVGIISSNVGGAGADTVGPVTFETYTNGSVNGQDGWTSTGSYDQAVVNTSAFPGAPASFGNKTLRISDSVTSGSFGDQTFSKSTVNAAGEPGADTGGFPTGPLQSHLSASFNFASATPLLYQPGMHMSVSPDRGDGARMSYVRIEDSPLGYNLFFDDYVDIAPQGATGTPDDGCQDTGDGPGNGNGVTGDGFREIPIAINVSRNAAHNLSFDIKYVTGGHNDVVNVSLDGNVVATGTSWEDYYRYCAESGGGTGGPLADQTRITRNLEFRESGSADLANAGKGILIDGVTLATASAPAAPHPVAAVPLNKGAKVNWKAQANGGSPITGYVVTPYIGATAQPARTFNSAATSEVITGLANKTAYTFKIAATNAVGTGPQSPATGMTIAGAPGKPGMATVTNGTPGVLKVAFKAPMNNGAAITNFTATCTSTNGGVTKSRSKATGSPIGVTGLTVGKAYKCTVFATNSRGAGPRSDPSATKVA